MDDGSSIGELSRFTTFDIALFINGKSVTSCLGRWMDILVCSNTTHTSDPLENEAYSLATMEILDRRLTYRFSKNGFSSGATLRDVWVAGFHQQTSGVLVDGTDWETWQEVEENGSYYVHLTDLALTVDTEFSIVFTPK